MENNVCVFECVEGCGVIAEVTLPLYFPSKMRWMFAINSAVTVSWGAEPSRMEQLKQMRNAVCMFVYVCVLTSTGVCECVKEGDPKQTVLWGPLSLYRRRLYADQSKWWDPSSICSRLCPLMLRRTHFALSVFSHIQLSVWDTYSGPLFVNIWGTKWLSTF